MIFDINIDSADDILAIRTAIITGNFVNNGGLTVVSWNSEGTSVTKQWAMSPIKLLEETREFLREYDPDLYGSIVKRTMPYYTSY